MTKPDRRSDARPGIGRRGLGFATLAVGFGGGQGAAQGGIALAQSASGGFGRIQPRDDAVPAFGFVAEDGTALDQGFLAGRPAVLNFWATWCAPCVEEMPALDRLAAALERPGIRVLALSQDRGGAAVVRGFYERTGVKRLGIWLDPRGAASRAFGARGLPTTVLVSAGGRIVGWAEGALHWDADEVVATVRSSLGA